MDEEFKRELERLVNKYGYDQISNTPDFLIAEYMFQCFHAYNEAKNESIRLFPSLQSNASASETSTQ